MTPTQSSRPTLQLAGMALLNGVLIIGPTHWAAAVRDSSGGITIASRRRVQAGVLTSLPVIRGPLRLAEMLSVLPAVRVSLPAARLPMESPRVAAVMLAGNALSHAVRLRRGRGTIADPMVAAGTLATMLAVLHGSALSQYHGAEHKAIGGYEQGIPAAAAAKEHERCGTHLAVPMVVINLLSHGAARAIIRRSPATASLLGSVVGLVGSTELIRQLQRSGPRTPILKLIRGIGMGLQSRASTREPRADQLAVAEAALARLLEVETAA